MTAQLPAGLEPGDEIAVEYEHNEDEAQVTATLGAVKIEMTFDPDNPELLSWLLAAVPGVLSAVSAAIEKENASE